jgi:transposase
VESQVDAERNRIPRIANGMIGIDPGFNDVITTSGGEKVPHPKELQQSIERPGQAQRGINRKLVARLHERIKNQRKDRNHRLSLRLVQENSLIVFSKDNIKGMAKKFGKSVASSGHAELRNQIAYKCLAGGTRYMEVSGRNSTKTCSSCGSLSGPSGLSMLSVRQWSCGCGAKHDRDVNAAGNTLLLGMECAALQELRNSSRNPPALAVGRFNMDTPDSPCILTNGNPTRWRAIIMPIRIGEHRPANPA